METNNNNDEDREEKESITKRRSIPTETQAQIKKDIRKYMATQGKAWMAENLSVKYGVHQVTIYRYIKAVIVEDIKDIKRENLVADLMANRTFRRRTLLGLLTKMNNREEESRREVEENLAKPEAERDKRKLFPIEYPVFVKSGILRDLRAEDEMLIEVLQELSFIEKPAEHVVATTDIFVGNILQNLQEKVSARLIDITPKDVTNESKESN